MRNAIRVTRRIPQKRSVSRKMLRNRQKEPGQSDMLSPKSATIIVARVTTAVPTGRTNIPVSCKATGFNVSTRPVGLCSSALPRRGERSRHEWRTGIIARQRALATREEPTGVEGIKRRPECSAGSRRLNTFDCYLVSSLYLVRTPTPADSR